MALRNVGEFLGRLTDLGELCRVSVEVDPDLEIAAITDRMSKEPDGGTALLFEQVKGSCFPVATNLFGSAQRMAAALDLDDLKGLTRRMESLLATVPEKSLAGKLTGLKDAPALTRFTPFLETDPPCQEMVSHDPDLRGFPFLRLWPEDTGSSLTLPLVCTRDLESGEANCGMYRVGIFSGDRVGIHWQRGSGGARHWLKYQQAGKRMPVAVALGGAPAITLVAAMPLPEQLDELQFAGFIAGQPLAVASCLTGELHVPAGAELVLEGYIDPGDMEEGGAFGNHTGSYVPVGEVPVMRVTCITRRREMICPATVIGPPPMEDCYLAKAAERLLLPLSRVAIPSLVDINLPFAGIFHGCAIVSIRKESASQPQEVLAALWKEGWLHKSRMMVIVDADVAVADPERVAWTVVNHADWTRDLVVHGNRLGIDATRKAVPGRREICPDEAVTELVKRRWTEYVGSGITRS
jgi:4-hydroxy-3-polyprenylbenzoate decarboxylase